MRQGAVRGSQVGLFMLHCMLRARSLVLHVLLGHCDVRRLVTKKRKHVPLKLIVMPSYLESDMSSFLLHRCNNFVLLDPRLL
jgi:hypothetical protein